MAERPAEEEQFNTWAWDEAAGGFRDLNATGAQARTLFELSEGRFNVIGNTVRDVPTGRIVGNLSTVHGSTLSMGSEGSMFLNNGIARQDVNQAGGRTVMQRASITVRLPADEANPAKVLSGVTSLTQFGGGIYTVMGAPRGPADFENVDLVPDRSQAGEPTRFKLPLAVGLYRRATPGETLNRSVSGWLARNAFEEIAARIQGLGNMNYLQRQQAIADAINTLGITIEVAPFITYNLSGGE